MISLITVCFNSSKTIEDTLRSVLEQNSIQFEYIVIDGGSTDGTLDIIKKYNEYIDILISERDGGIYDAINKGISKSSGDIIGILNSDDTFAHSMVLSDIDNLFRRNLIDMYWANVNFVNHSNKVIRTYLSSNSPLRLFRFGFMPAHPSFYCKKTLFDMYGFYRTDLKIAADFELLLRFLMNNDNYYYHNRIIVNMKIGGISTLGIKSNLVILKEIYISCKLNNINTNYFFLLLKYPIKLFQFNYLKLLK